MKRVKAWAVVDESGEIAQVFGHTYPVYIMCIADREKDAASMIDIESERVVPVVIEIEAADALDAKDARIRELDAELLSARAEAALQHNWNCEHDGGCALTHESGYRPQALKYVEDYHALKARIRELEGALKAIIERWDTPLWKDAEPTGAVINRAREALK